MAGFLVRKKEKNSLNDPLYLPQLHQEGNNELFYPRPFKEEFRRIIK